MTKKNYYVITGGPGSGKTSLLKSLTAYGFLCIEETARKIIKERVSKGYSPRPEPKQFADEIFKQDLKNYRDYTERNDLLFFDRSILDSTWQLFNADPSCYESTKVILDNFRYNEKVFITSPWKDIFSNDEERDQTFEESIQIFEGLRQWYLKHDYEIILLPNDSIKKRMSFLLNEINH